MVRVGQKEQCQQHTLGIQSIHTLLGDFCIKDLCIKEKVKAQECFLVEHQYHILSAEILQFKSIVTTCDLLSVK